MSSHLPTQQIGIQKWVSGIYCDAWGCLGDELCECEGELSEHTRLYACVCLFVFLRGERKKEKKVNTQRTI